MSLKMRTALTTILILSLILVLGCGPEEHSPYVNCINIGVENVRRNLHIRVSVNVGRKPLEGVSTETVRLIKTSSGTSIPGEVYYSGERIIFMPGAPLDDNTDYRFEILSGITDASGKEMKPMHQYFTTGDILQVYYVDLLRDYDASAGKVYSIGIYFSEGVDSSNLRFNISVLEDDWNEQFYDLVYYEDIALAVLVFDYPLELERDYKLTVSSDIISSSDLGWLDGDRDGSETDREPFVLNFRYESDPIEGINVADSTSNAHPYNEPTERCFLEEFD